MEKCEEHKTIHQQKSYRPSKQLHTKPLIVSPLYTSTTERMFRPIWESVRTLVRYPGEHQKDFKMIYVGSRPKKVPACFKIMITKPHTQHIQALSKPYSRRPPTFPLKKKTLTFPLKQKTIYPNSLASFPLCPHPLAFPRLLRLLFLRSRGSGLRLGLGGPGRS